MYVCTYISVCLYMIMHIKGKKIRSIDPDLVVIRHIGVVLAHNNFRSHPIRCSYKRAAHLPFFFVECRDAKIGFTQKGRDKM